MTFPAYSAYKDSGVDWLGVVPEHWVVTLLKRGYEVVLGKMLQPEAKRDDDDFLPYLRAANIQLSGVDTVDVKRMWFGAEEKKSLLLRRGDLLVSEGGDVGRSAIWEFDEEECYFQNSINRIRSIDGNNTRFLYFWMIAIKKNGYVDVLCNKSTIAHFTAEKVAAVPLPIPTKPEQTQIARFLDHETARIDALIEEQQRLIELLKEKRQAVISHAVTKGLDPTVSMKDSGVLWLGEVPAHWDVKRLKHLCSDIKAGPFGSALTKDMYVATGYKIYGQEQVIPCDFDIGDYYIDEDRFASLNQYQVRPGDVLMSCVGTFGKIAVVPEAVEPGIINPRLIRVRVNSLVSSQYLSTVLRSAVVFEQFTLLSRGGTMDVINIGTLSEIVLALPPVDEQLGVLLFITDQTRRFDNLVDQAFQGVALLQERRSALISAAVTGKIDVRGWQPPASAPTPELAQEAV